MDNNTDFEAALERLKWAAMQAGVSLQEAVATANAFAQTGASLANNTIQDAIKQLNKDNFNTLKEATDYLQQEPDMICPIPEFNLDDYKVNVEEDPISWSKVSFGGFEEREVPELHHSKKGVSICLRRDTEENCGKSTLLLREGEVCLVQKPNGDYYAVVGDGKSQILKCPRLVLN